MHCSRIWVHTVAGVGGHPKNVQSPLGCVGHCAAAWMVGPMGAAARNAWGCAGAAQLCSTVVQIAPACVQLTCVQPRCCV
jgi:hypothetical protein